MLANPMRKEYGKALRALFQHAIQQKLPSFSPISVESLFVGERAFRWIPREPLHCWVILVPDRGQDAFTIDLAWSRRRRFPELDARPSLAAAGANVMEHAVRLGTLIDDTDRWWTIDSLELTGSLGDVLAELRRSVEPVPMATARARVAPLVESAIADLQRYGVPYFERIARSPARAR
jgi:hypothetical protein